MRSIIISALLILGLNAFSQELDLSKAIIVASENIPALQRTKFIQVLQEEIGKRTDLQWGLSAKSASTPLVILALSTDKSVAGKTVPSFNESSHASKPEGFKVLVDGQQVWLIGNDNRGVLYAIGSFLTGIRWSKQKVTLPMAFAVETSPAYPLRGHQLGFRNTANSWDGWTIREMEQYIRELALFGSMAIENIPFHDGRSPHFKVTREEMNRAMSSLCRDYGLDYWVWAPGDVDLSKHELVKQELEKHELFYKQCVKLDGVFFPGGDPGNNHPNVVMPFLKSLSGILKKYHPAAGLWISMQGFSDDEVNYFYEYLEKHDPDWLAGVVTGPSSPSLSSTRFRLPKKYKHRHYPDITHNVRSQFPVPNWDHAFALTLGREASNPRPVAYGKIHNQTAPFTDGFISYSDGAHDDVNKIVWSQLGWDPGKDIHSIVADYARFHFGDALAQDVADGIFALEQNWSGPIEENGAIETSFHFWKALEKKGAHLSSNWRWQLLVLRAYYDVYQKRRKQYEERLETEANAILVNAKMLGIEKAMDMALEKVNEAVNAPIEKEMASKIEVLCEQLFQSMQLQTSVEKYKASGSERGAILDFLYRPLNNRWWLEDEFAKIKKMQTEEEKLKRLAVIASWENPGPGSYYDDVSNISKSTHVKTRSEDGTDFMWDNNGKSRKRLSTLTYQNFPELEYHDLDPRGKYIIRVAGYGDALLRIDGVRVEPTMYNKGMEEFKEFPLNPKFFSDGSIKLSFDQPEESHLNWRQHSKVSDIWLIKLKD